jgi:hypothetical protein
LIAVRAPYFSPLVIAICCLHTVWILRVVPERESDSRCGLWRVAGVSGSSKLRGARERNLFGQIRIGQELATEGDQISHALFEPFLGRVLVESTGDNESAAMFLSNEIDIPQCVRCGTDPLLEGRNRRVHGV